VTLVIALALTVFSIGTYLVWPSRWNIPAHIQLSFVLTAYAVPVLMTDSLSHYPRALLEFYALLCGVSAVCFLIGLVCGSALPRMKVFGRDFAFASLSEAELLDFVSRRAIWLGLFSIAGMIASFYYMGFVPAFAANTTAAKYLRGIYQERYRDVAVLYRGSEQIILVTLPIVLVLWYVTRRKLFALIGLLQIAVQSLTLARGMCGIPLLTGLGLIAVSRGYKTFTAYLAVLVFGVGLASATSYYALRVIEPRLAIFQEGTVWDEIASGAPDIRDALNFLTAFEQRPAFTYGRTFFGGLVPFHYRWNPSVWSVRVVDSDEEEDINTVISGGLRLPPPVHGYTAFGWPGAIIVCFLSGLATGYGAVFARTYVRAGSLVGSVIALSIYNTAIDQFARFYHVEIYTTFAIFVTLIFVYRVGVRPRQTVEVGADAALSPT